MQGPRYRPELSEGEGVTQELTNALKQYEEWFLLDPPKLKMISDHFAQELEKGLTVEGGSIPMNVTWIMKYPTGHEKGRILTVDLGGTNIRVCDVCLSMGRRDFEQRQRKYKLPEEVKKSTKEALWGFIADRIDSFLSDNHSDVSASEPLPMAFTFSFPVEQKSIRSGILQRWTKNFSVPGVVGHDVVLQLEEELAKRNVPVRLVALINDTAGTLVASHYRDPQVKIGSIFSTGCNAAYMEECRLIPKLRDSGLSEDATVIVNTEYGAFDNERKVLPLTPFDHQLDAESAHPGTQIYEKMVAGLYIGEMLRLVMLAMYEQGLLFKGQDISRLRTANSLEASFLSSIEMDISAGLADMKEVFKESLSLDLSTDELKACRHLIGLIAMRAARLYACGIAAICKKKGIRQCHVGVDGSVFSKYSMLKGRTVQGLRDIFDWDPERLDLIALNSAEDGSGVGAALVAKLTASLSSLGKGTIFDETTYELESNSDAINIEVNISVLNRALRSAWGSTHTQLRLTKKDKTPLLALTVLSSEWTDGNMALATNNDADRSGEPNPAASADTTGDRGPRERQTWITQEVPIKILHESAVEGLHEPHCPDPEVHIILPNLAQLKSISDRFTKLASTDSKSRQPGVMAPDAPGMHSVSFSTAGAATALSTNSSPKLELSANMHGSLRLAIATDELRIASVWSDLVNPPLDPAQMSQEQMSQLPSELNRKREASEGSESGWAKVRIDGKDWSRVLSIGRLSPKVVACFVNEMALVLYVYLPGSRDGEESCLTYYINSFTT
ncbi:Hexokinase N-terminal [Penicillium cf. griseofulvum]|uniref:hexokinase n=1 Tax=Penicillium cf. griseofulvum TaxID=2972120 RepID=A0A9W9MQ71_9EURO|nr:Hexokinase N-terminal [Penicillium cf. griseofulvum]KAJ5437430.1 Hexokinase N-terminal [Penicillium cf. griseofulvum]KAJ5441577.1 Hexokinase N-terminal [Penicillium cf. griseofulvum]